MYLHESFDGSSQSSMELSNLIVTLIFVGIMGF